MKLEMITYSYEQVLDATKHQDDKIGQLITGIAFLTAATAVLTALGPGDSLAREFIVRPFTFPLSLIALIIFLIGVAWSVLLLLVSLSAPLRSPFKPRENGIRWANDVKYSQIFFHDMAKTSSRLWVAKWNSDVNSLKKERFDTLVRETHNLGVRTTNRHFRTEEAFPLLTMSLLAFMLSIFFFGIAAAYPLQYHTAPPDIALNLWQRVVLGGIFGCYAWLQARAKIRHKRQDVDQTPGVAELCSSISLGFVMGSMLVFDKSWPGAVNWIWATALFLIAFLISFWLAGAPASAPTSEKENRLARAMILIAAAAVGALGIWSGNEGWYAGQLGVTAFVILVLTGVEVSGPIRQAREYRRKYREGT